MRVFVTGATGWVGSAVVRELLGAGHAVTGLARSEQGAAALEAAGAVARRGSIEDLAGLRQAAAEAEGVIHLAFNHDFSRFVENCEDDRRAIEALGAALEGSERPLLVTGGLAMLAQGRPGTETDTPPVDSPHYPRKSEVAAAAVAARGVRVGVVRLAPSVHGVGEHHGFVPMLIGLARRSGRAAYVGDGMNRWPGVHRLDAARLYRLALERGAAGGPCHACDEQGVPTREIAAVIGRRLGVPVVSLAAEEAAQHFGWFIMFAGMDMAASSERTRAQLGWVPREPGLLADIDQPAYISGASPG